MNASAALLLPPSLNPLGAGVDDEELTHAHLLSELDQTLRLVAARERQLRGGGRREFFLGCG